MPKIVLKSNNQCSWFLIRTMNHLSKTMMNTKWTYVQIPNEKLSIQFLSECFCLLHNKNETERRNNYIKKLMGSNRFNFTGLLLFLPISNTISLLHSN